MLAPLARACRAAGFEPSLAWCGGEAALADASALGLPRPDHVALSPDEAPPAARFVAATAFAGQLLASGPWHAILTFGHGTTAVASGVLAHRIGGAVVRLDAGQRSHVPGDLRDQQRRAADHAASVWCVPDEQQRLELLREGLRADCVHVVGSLLPAALAAQPPAPPAPPALWLALEHAATVADAATLRALLDRVVAAARSRGMPVRAAAPGLAPALAQFRLPLPAGLELCTGWSARDQLDAARTAAAVLTDSAGHQELAAVAGVPCVAFGAATARPETLLAGTAALVPADGAGLAEALARQLDRRPPRSPYADGLAGVVAVLQRLGPRPAAAPAARSVGTLPSDADHSGRTLGDEEVAFAAAAIRSGTLNSTRGTFVARFERQFADWLGTRHAVACSSGTMAVHAAIAAVGLQPGDEVITTPITDMGAITPILYEGGVPVFADVDPTTLNVTAATIAAQLTDRTRAIVVTHLFGAPCDLAPIVALAAARGVLLIEDCAQAFGATCGDRKVGTFGRIATFSLQQGKHITCGEGGIVATDDPALARRLFLFVNKAWGYGDPRPDHGFPALNGRLSELQGAVALAQLPKLDWVVGRRRAVAAELRERLADVDVLALPGDPPHGRHAWWKFAFGVDAARVADGAAGLGRRMQAAGIACVPRYIQKPAFECGLFTDWRRSPVTWLPLQHNPRRDRVPPPFQRADYPGAVAGLERVVVLPINERYRSADVAHVAAVIRTAAHEALGG